MKKNLYILGVLLSVLFWTLSILYFYKLKAEIRPRVLVQSVQDDLSLQQRDAENLIKGNQSVIRHLWENRLSEAELRVLLNKKYIIQLFENGHLIFWNNNFLAFKEQGIFEHPKAIFEDKNVFVIQTYFSPQYPNKRINVIVPICHHFDIENEYIQSNFAANAQIPSGSKIAANKFDSGIEIKSSNNTTLFYLQVNAADIKPLVPNNILFVLIVLAMLCTIQTVHLFAVYLSRNYFLLLGSLLILTIIVVVKLLIHILGLPFNLGEVEIFSSQLFASNAFLPSLGHLCLHILSVYWLLSFTQGQINKYNSTNAKQISPLLRGGIFFVVVLSISCVSIYIKVLFQSIVFDSDISFDTNSFDATSQFTLVALVAVAILSRLYWLILQLGVFLVRKYIPNKQYRTIPLFLTCLILLLVYTFSIKLSNNCFGTKKDAIITVLWITWAISYVYIASLKSVRSVFARSSLFAIIFLSAIYLKFNIDTKEESITRIAFAEKLSRQQDSDLELRLSEFANQIEADTIIKNWFIQKKKLSIQDIYKHLKVLNGDIYFTKFNQEVYLFDQSKLSLIANEMVSLDSLFNIQKQSMPTTDSLLYFYLDQSDRGAYLTLIPINDKINHVFLGYVGIYFSLKTNISKSLYPELLKNNLGKNTHQHSYEYAIYINNKLANQYGNYNFKFNIAGISINRQFQYANNNDYSELSYKAAPNLVYVVVYKNNFAIGVLTIFSFLFAISLMVGIVENWFEVLSFYTLTGRKIKISYNGSLSVRIKYFALGFTAISFFIIGVSTVYFLIDRYKDNDLKTLETNMTNISEFVIDYLQTQKSIVANKDLKSQLIQNDFTYFITNIAQQQKLDINIFDTAGSLAFTTQESIYQKKILAERMNYEAFYMLKEKKIAGYIKNINIGSLVYTASYNPIINHENKLIGYINIPSLNTQQNLDSQIISLVTTLVNIYTILLLISSIITFLFINSLTKSLRLVADSFKNVNLKKNELIQWPYNDEIGLLVKEYNTMVGTVEKNARSLVLDERQNAWREMAQQVAHEIKNPLTPMKLNIQYLQQAINSNHPDIINLTKRVSGSIIEQIDNLNYIASEFSNFAKLPENKTERIDLKSMLERIVLLFEGDKKVKISYSFPKIPVVIFADKSQMLRIFTNIVQNAVESIDNDVKEGEVKVDLLFTSENDAVIIKVADNGEGIAQEVQDKIFDPYFTTKSPGTGLGLAMTKKIIELWGGSIRFESVVNQGTTFYLTVPLGT
ncbi:MAG: ATP-binding protein [Phycisphaerales bacterium]|nr:ATP-binding protein [Phycisphaerales bacterium]